MLQWCDFCDTGRAEWHHKSQNVFACDECAFDLTEWDPRYLDADDWYLLVDGAPDDDSDTDELVVTHHTGSGQWCNAGFDDEDDPWAVNTAGVVKGEVQPAVPAIVVIATHREKLAERAKAPATPNYTAIPRQEFVWNAEKRCTEFTGRWIVWDPDLRKNVPCDGPTDTMC